MRGHVAQHDADPSLRKAEEGVEVAPHRGHRDAAHRDPRLALEHGRLGHEPELQVVREGELVLEPLLLPLPRGETGVLDGGADLVGDRGHQLPVARGKAIRIQ